MSFLYLKTLHIIFIVTWFAGLFYIVRLFIYHTEANEKKDPEKSILINQFKIMEKRLWYGITWPSAILTFILGPSLLHQFIPLQNHPWLMAKLFFVVLLLIYHLCCGIIFKQLQAGMVKYSSTQLRIWNEVATIILFAVVFLVELKSILSMTHGLIGLFLFAILLMLGIRIYKKVRQ
jgi:putative membrane protein